MHSETDIQKLRDFMETLGRRVRGAGRIYLTGGATAILQGWRSTTIDVDLKADPEPEGLFEAIAELKNQLGLNVELASPDHFIPPLPGWRERSLFIARHGKIDFFHFDFYSQALSKIERGHARDLADVKAMIDRRLISVDQLKLLFSQIEPDLLRYPAIEPSAFRGAVDAFCAPYLKP